MSNIEVKECDLIIGEITDNLVKIHEQQAKILQILKLISQQLVISFSKENDDQQQETPEL